MSEPFGAKHLDDDQREILKRMKKRMDDKLALIDSINDSMRRIEKDFWKVCMDMFPEMSEGSMMSIDGKCKILVWWMPHIEED